MTSNVLRNWQIFIFALGWISYGATYFLRKPIGVVKADMETELQLTKSELGWLDTALFFPYAVAQMLLGRLGDRFGAKRTFGLSLILAGCAMASFGSWSTFPMFFALLFLNGTGQSQAWPNCTKVLSAWYPDDRRNTVFGMFGTCFFVGGIAGTALAVHLQTNYGWRAVFLPPSMLMVLLGIAVVILFKTPSEVGLEVPGKAVTTSDASGQKAVQLSLLQIWRIPVVSEIAWGVFSLKAVRYCMYMWLPMFLLQKLNYSKAQAGMFSTMFEIGGVVGSAGIGIVLDRCFGGRALLGCATCCLLCTISLIIFTLTSGWGIAVNSLFLFLAGVFNCAPDAIIGGSVPSELGEMEGRNAAAAVAGLVNGFGSVGTFLQGPIIGVMSDKFGFGGLFWALIALQFFGTIVVSVAARKHAALLQQVRNVGPQTA